MNDSSTSTEPGRTSGFAQGDQPAGSPALCIVGSCGLRLWGMTPAERLRLQFAKAGIGVELTPTQAARHQGRTIAVRADAVLDQPLIPVLLARPDLLLIGEGPDGAAPLAAQVEAKDVATLLDHLAGRGDKTDLALLPSTPAELGADFWKTLRKRETPYALLVTPAMQAQVEWRMFMGTYKGATDLVTKHLWPRPAFYATRWLAARRVTPNLVTLCAAALVFLAFWLFLQGLYLPGLMAAWAMTFLDTVDGKLARATLTSSKWGDVFDHGIDLIHPPFWYAAWALGLGRHGLALDGATFILIIGAILSGYVLQRLIEGIAIAWLGLEIHIWRPIDTAFRQITARRNPNLVILTLFTLVGRPDWGLVAVAAWTLICLLLHVLQLVQALMARRSGPLASWMISPP